MAPKLYKAQDVCEMTQLQTYVLRSWEHEFPGIGVRKSEESPRLYRETDVEQIQRIKRLVFEEGLTLAGARRRLEQSSGAAAGVSDDEVNEVLDALGVAARERIANVQQGLRSILSMLGTEPGSLSLVAPTGSARGDKAQARDGAGKSSSAGSRKALSSSKSRVGVKPAPAKGKAQVARKAKRARA